MTNVITLEENVIVSDPCYSIPSFGQETYSNVLPGEYRVFCKKHDAGDWGNRVSMLMVVHTDYVSNELSWKQNGNIGVDSGQAGIFNVKQFRQDNDEVPLGDGDISFFGETFIREEGDRWYTKICSHTLGNKRWGSYKDGTVSSSGFGDGGYDVFTTYGNGKYVGICIDYAVEETEFVDFDWYKDHAL